MRADICPSRDGAAPHFYRGGRCMACYAPGPNENPVINPGAAVSKPAGSSGWRNEYEVEVPLVSNAYSDAEVIAAVRAEYPVGSSWGALRWRAGVYDIVVDRYDGVVRFRESEGMAD